MIRVVEILSELVLVINNVAYVISSCRWLALCSTFIDILNLCVDGLLECYEIVHVDE